MMLNELDLVKFSESSCRHFPSMYEENYSKFQMIKPVGFGTPVVSPVVWRLARDNKCKIDIHTNRKTIYHSHKSLSLSFTINRNYGRLSGKEERCW